eukprot:3763507-Rhodomonas_salina.2
MSQSLSEELKVALADLSRAQLLADIRSSPRACPWNVFVLEIASSRRCCTPFRHRLSKHLVLMLMENKGKRNWSERGQRTLSCRLRCKT